MRVLELGSYVVPAYAGMVLAEQGHEVTKWVAQTPDPIEALNHGHRLWKWINAGKHIEERHARRVGEYGRGFDGILDNIRPSTWERWGVDREALSTDWGIPWVSMQGDDTGRSFDLIAQARAWGDHLGLLPAYLGDTAPGLWLAFKLLCAPPGHHVLTQAACLAKLVEGELVVDVPRNGRAVPWDNPAEYGPDKDGQARVVYRGQTITEPLRDSDWRRENLRHVGGRYLI